MSTQVVDTCGCEFAITIAINPEIAIKISQLLIFFAYVHSIRSTLNAPLIYFVLYSKICS